ncbi:MAG: hypothetical protein LBK13_12935 [Spirochaetales bacterium]|nr:hypothetical protein [Spirochaetales bacterium]
MVAKLCTQFCCSPMRPGWSRICIRKFAARPCVLAGGKIAKRFCAAAARRKGLQRKARRKAHGRFPRT